jgi:hypothetical protein
VRTPWLYLVLALFLLIAGLYAAGRPLPMPPDVAPDPLSHTRLPEDERMLAYPGWARAEDMDGHPTYRTADALDVVTSWYSQNLPDSRIVEIRPGVLVYVENPSMRVNLKQWPNGTEILIWPK